MILINFEGLLIIWIANLLQASDILLLLVKLVYPSSSRSRAQIDI